MVTEVGPTFAFLLRLGRLGPTENTEIEISTLQYVVGIRYPDS
jgi:hypothetical protein